MLGRKVKIIRDNGMVDYYEVVDYCPETDRYCIIDTGALPRDRWVDAAWLRNNGKDVGKGWKREQA